MSHNPYAVDLSSLTSPETSKIVTSPRESVDMDNLDPITQFNARMPLSLIDAMHDARRADRIPVTRRIRALVELWRDDPKLRERVAERAAQIKDRG